MKTQHDLLMEDPEFRKMLSIETLSAEAAEVIAGLMADQNITKADLARRLNKSRAWVTQLLSGKTNMTVRTLAEVAHVLESEIKLHAQPPKWKLAGKPSGAAWQPIPCKLDNYSIEPSITAGKLFRLQDDKTTSSSDDPASNHHDPDNSEYAA